MAGNTQYCQSMENYKYIIGDFTMEIKEAKEILNKNGFILEDSADDKYKADLAKMGRYMANQGTEDYIKNVAKLFAKNNKLSVEEVTGIMLNYMFRFLAKYQDQGCPATAAATDENVIAKFKEESGK